MSRTALVAGATGVAGTAVVEELSRQGGWTVLALSRSIRPGHFPRPNVISVPADASNPADLAGKLSAHRITHVFYTAQHFLQSGDPMRPVPIAWMKRGLRLAGWFTPLLIGKAGWIDRFYYTSLSKQAGLHDPESRNLAMLRNVIEAVSRPPHDLQHVAMVTGGRYNGMHMGPRLYPDWNIPFTEDAPRFNGSCWYYGCEDFLKDHDWSWSVVRPSFIIGHADGAPQNFGTALAVYAAIMKAQNKPLIFTGARESYDCRWTLSSAETLARQMIWSATDARARNNAFNSANRTPFRWRDLWPALAELTGLEPELSAKPVSVLSVIGPAEEIWAGLAAKHGLRTGKLSDVFSVRFFDQSMIIDWDVEYSLDKSRKAGFNSFEGDEEMFRTLLTRLRESRIIPPV